VYRCRCGEHKQLCIQELLFFPICRMEFGHPCKKSVIIGISERSPSIVYGAERWHWVQRDRVADLRAPALPHVVASDETEHSLCTLCALTSNIHIREREGHLGPFKESARRYEAMFVRAQLVANLNSMGQISGHLQAWYSSHAGKPPCFPKPTLSGFVGSFSQTFVRKYLITSRTTSGS